MAASSLGRIAAAGANHVQVQALEDVSITITHGDRVALIGGNGAGKSTLLRVMAGIYEPTSGAVSLEGQAATLFDSGLGTDPEGSGYENIMLRGLYLGLSKAEIKRKTVEIADFTGLGAFLGLPLRTYSSGMQARLAFAISTCIEPEVLLLDEGIGAGDAAFLEKAKARIDALVVRAGIVVLASHSEELVRQFCTEAVLLNQGRIVVAGPIESVLERYHESSSAGEPAAAGRVSAA
jgi:ABC-2 type transport system ATP-binding protein/lipopolysaccharide transport system ATP-binding protein